jgi:hypothetical protein
MISASKKTSDTLFFVCTSIGIACTIADNHGNVLQENIKSFISRKKQNDIYGINEMMAHLKPTTSGRSVQVINEEDTSSQILDLQYRTDYDRSMNPCTCSQDALDPSVLVSKCKYDYCETCLSPSFSELCGYTYGETTYTSETTTSSFSLQTKSRVCIQYTRVK